MESWLEIVRALLFFLFKKENKHEEIFDIPYQILYHRVLTAKGDLEKVIAKEEKRRKGLNK